MKDTLLTILLVTGFWLTGCQPSANVQEVLEDESKRKELYSTILNNDSLRTEMMTMMRNTKAGDMMENKGHMEGMMGSDGMMMNHNPEAMQGMMQQMMAQCETDTATCNMMSRMMMRHSGMMQNMMQRMQENGMMDETCMQQMMRNMKSNRR